MALRDTAAWRMLVMHLRLLWLYAGLLVLLATLRVGQVWAALLGA